MKALLIERDLFSIHAHTTHCGNEWLVRAETNPNSSCKMYQFLSGSAEGQERKERNSVTEKFRQQFRIFLPWFGDKTKRSYFAWARQIQFPLHCVCYEQFARRWESRLWSCLTDQVAKGRSALQNKTPFKKVKVWRSLNNIRGKSDGALFLIIT